MNKPRLPILSSLLLAGIFVFGFGAGAFMYATGAEVITSTYMNMVSHTEYRYAEDGQIIARLVDFQGAPVTVNNCTADILYPDKSFFVNDGLMSTSGISGDHYYNFTTPSGPEGVYEYQATCFYTQGSQTKNRSVTNSFHLSSAFTNVLNNLTQLSSDLTAINASLSTQLDTLATQDNITTVLTELSNVNSSLSNQLNSNTTTILNAISGITFDTTNILVAINDSLDDMIFSDAGGDADQDITEYWTILDTPAKYNNTFGYNFPSSGSYDVGGSIQLGDIVTGNSAYINLTDPTYAALSQREKFDDVTYELMMYSTTTNTGNSLESAFAWDVYELDLTFSQNRVVQINDYTTGEAQTISYDVGDEGIGQWHLIQIHFFDYDEVNGTFSYELYVDDVYAGFIGMLPIGSGEPVEWLIGHGGNTGGAGPLGTYVDNVRVYEGSPEERNVKLAQIEDAVTVVSEQITNLSTQLDTNVSQILAELSVVQDNQVTINTTLNSVTVTLADMETTLNNVNTTTTNTYNYLTGTLTTNVNQILTDLGVINATVNRIETNTIAINATTNTILENQENEVFMNVFSG